MSIYDLIASYSKVHAKSIGLLCPFHEEKTPSFLVNEETYFCLGCGTKGLTANLMRRPTYYRKDYDKPRTLMTFESFEAMKEYFKQDKKQTPEQPDNSDCNQKCKCTDISFSVSKEDITRIFELRGMLMGMYFHVLASNEEGLTALLDKVTDMYDDIICNPIKESIDIE